MAEVSISPIPGISIGFGGDSLSPSYFDRLSQTVWTAINAAENLIIGDIQKGLSNNLYWNDRMTDKIMDRIGLAEFNISSKTDSVIGLLNSVLSHAANQNNSVIEVNNAAIMRALGAGKQEIIDTIGVGIGNVIGRIVSGEQSIGKVLSGIDLKLDSVLGAVASVAQQIADRMLQKVEYTINNTIHLDSNIFDVILGRVNEAMRDQLTITGRVIDVFDHTLNTTFQDALVKQTVALNRVADAAVARGQSSPSTGTTTPPHVGSDGENIKPESVLGTINNWLDFSPDFIATTIRDLKRAIIDIAAGDSKKNPLEDDCLIPLFKDDSSSGIFRAIAQTIIYAIASGTLPIQMAQVQSNRLIQKYRTCFPDHVFSVPELQAMHYIMGYDAETLMPWFNMQGYSRSDAQQIVRTWQTVPDLTLLSNMLYRGIIGKGEWQTEMRKHGFTSSMVDNIHGLLEYLPPVSDLVVMSVRDVFDPATVALNRQTEDFPQDFLKWAAKQGVSEYWAKKYWEAHWRLPSETMGFEMFHRGIIDETRLKSLMKSLDIMPGWRDQLLQLSYSPLTRVDVRRMHSVGVLSEAEVERAYKDIGYSPENARRLTEFTVRLNEGESNLTTDVSSDLSKSQIIGLYKDGIFDRTVANGLLLQADVNVAAAELLLEAADLDIEQAERKQLRELILLRYKNGRYTFEEAVSEAQRLGFTDREREKIILELEIEQAKRHKLPAVADLGKMLKKGSITEDDYKAAMLAHGYSDYWADRFMEVL